LAVRLGLKSALGLAVAHIVLMAALAVGLERTLRSLEEELSANAVRLLAREQANLVFERSVAALASPDGESRRRLHERIQDLTVLSEVVTSLALVDADGHEVASEAAVRSRRRHPPAAEQFGSPPVTRLETGRPRPFLRGGDYVVLVPLVEAGTLAGYLRVGLHSDRVAGLYEQSRTRLVILMIAGLAAVAALSAVLQVQLTRRARSIAAVLEGGPAPPEAIPPTDEFARVLRSASRIKGDLEEARRQSQRRGMQVGALAGALQVGVVVAGADLEVDYVSARALELAGCADEHAFREAWRSLAPRLLGAMDATPAAPDGGRALRFEPCPGRPVRAELHPLADSGGDLLVVLSDPRAIEALEVDARLERQLEGLGRVHRMLAHELRAPLGAMMINADVLHEKLAQDGTADDTTRRHVDVLREEIQRLNSSLAGILAQTVPTESPERFDLNGSLADLVALLAPQASKQGVEVETRLPDGPLPMRGYPHRLRQALLNVAVNALEAMPGGGRLTVEARRDGARARVALRDTGPGIAPDALPRLFDFEFSTKNGGSGIGLHVARALVELHGGEIEVASAPGRGTDVEVVVPLAGGGA
jgi:signal transduction histidine kinase